ncbi:MULTISPECIES: DUF3368 domain-containing protein [Methanocalculus]|jgi:predicted nucleic acid-binding protein|uniref:DUF3368 domain-containing protein n=1 Tax=Methanocalculus taiwanensis TaxID=106207 RepID=A0ABD4TL75_9EURY|nr:MULTISPECIES: DUF3368 domain-containing protein [Methanocalculus]MCQ1538282.1 DUF3368 domain-containing protein [Methanocalculus taiwanensis]MDG6250321.1 DUF3368 domain-containing protein [Methanocalculus sp.]
MVRAISNSSPLIHLSLIGRIDLLRRFSSVIIPPAVWHEVVEDGDDRPGVAEILLLRKEGCLSVIQPKNTDLLHLLENDLHRGEAESIVLALEIEHDILLLDESEARRIAGSYNLNVTGVIGLLLRAKRDGHISSLEDEMARLRNEGHFWIRESLYNYVIESEKKMDDD